MSYETRDDSPELIQGTGDAFSDYLADIGVPELLTPEEEAHYTKLMWAGRAAAMMVEEVSAQYTCGAESLKMIVGLGIQARERMIESNRRLVVHVAKREDYRGRGTLADRVWEGNKGLERAVDKFDHTKGYRFSTYAVHWLKNFIQRGIETDSDYGIIRLPRNVIFKVRRAHAVFDAVSCEPISRTGEEILGEAASRLRTTVEEITQLLSWGDLTTVQSLDERLGNTASSVSRHDVVSGDGDFVDAVLDREMVLKALRYIAEHDMDNENRSLDVLMRRYGLGEYDPQPIAAIAATLGVSTGTVRNIEARAITVIRGGLGISPIKEIDE
jgi:RNA polymerase primary sigma factor